jgi:membrane-associated protein
MLNPENLIHAFGALAVLAVAAILFLETATIVLSFLPGDSLLFVLGLSLTTFLTGTPLWVAIPAIAVAAVAGPHVGYYLGAKLGHRILERRESRFFNASMVTRTEVFFEKYGPRSLVLARFIPVLRALVPMSAGIARMPLRTFALWNAVGGVLWTVSITLLGAALGNVAWIRNNIDLVAVVIVAVSGIPIVLEYVRHRRKK